jgi:quercetin dioxygenase-like cupin family protein
VFGDLYRFYNGGKRDGWEYAAVEITVYPTSTPPPMHMHHFEDEDFIILNGTVNIMTDGETHAKSAGSYMYHPRGTKHTFWSNGEHSRVLVIARPSGIEQLFREIGTPATLRHDEVPEENVLPTEAQMQTLMEKASQYGLEIIM